MNWHKVPFFCEKGHKGTILEVVFNADGTLVLCGLCVNCGAEFQVEYNVLKLVQCCAVSDHESDKTEDPTVRLLRNFKPEGRVN